MDSPRFPTVPDGTRRSFAGAAWEDRLLDDHLTSAVRTVPDKTALVEGAPG
jgi:hypothetical protein